MRIQLSRTSLAASSIVAAAGILAAGIALEPAFAGGTAFVGPFVIVKCSNPTACQTYQNSGLGVGLQGITVNKSPFVSGLKGVSTKNGNGVTGTSNTGNGVSGSGGNTGINGTGGTWGAFGFSTDGTGVEGQSNNGIGVEGFSSTFWGIEGASGNGVGIIGIGESGGAGVAAISGSGDGLDASTSGGNGGGVGAHVTNSSGNGADIEGTYIGVLARAPDCSSGAGFPLDATDQNGNSQMYVDCAGDLYINGVYGNFLKVRDGNAATAFASQTTSPTLEDNGTAHLVNGIAVVQLDRAFGQAIDMRDGYHVMLTPDGDTRGLYVASKTPTSFVVREVQGGRGTFDFDYHIYATTLGHAGQRMVELTPRQLAAMSPRSPIVPMPKLKIVIHKRAH